MERKGEQEQILPYDGLVVREGECGDLKNPEVFGPPKGFTLEKDPSGTTRLRTLDIKGGVPKLVSQRSNRIMDIL